MINKQVMPHCSHLASFCVPVGYFTKCYFEFGLVIMKMLDFHRMLETVDPRIAVSIYQRATDVVEVINSSFLLHCNIFPRETRMNSQWKCVAYKPEGAIYRYVKIEVCDWNEARIDWGEDCKFILAGLLCLSCIHIHTMLAVYDVFDPDVGAHKSWCM